MDVLVHAQKLENRSKFNVENVLIYVTVLLDTDLKASSYYGEILLPPRKSPRFVTNKNQRLYGYEVPEADADLIKKTASFSQYVFKGNILMRKAAYATTISVTSPQTTTLYKPRPNRLSGWYKPLPICAKSSELGRSVWVEL